MEQTKPIEIIHMAHLERYINDLRRYTSLVSSKKVHFPFYKFDLHTTEQGYAGERTIILPYINISFSSGDLIIVQEGTFATDKLTFQDILSLDSGQDIPCERLNKDKSQTRQDWLRANIEHLLNEPVTRIEGIVGCEHFKYQYRSYHKAVTFYLGDFAYVQFPEANGKYHTFKVYKTKEDGNTLTKPELIKDRVSVNGQEIREKVRDKFMDLLWKISDDFKVTNTEMFSRYSDKTAPVPEDITNSINLNDFGAYILLAENTNFNILFAYVQSILNKVLGAEKIESDLTIKQVSCCLADGSSHEDMVRPLFIDGKANTSTKDYRLIMSVKEALDKTTRFIERKRALYTLIIKSLEATLDESRRVLV